MHKKIRLLIIVSIIGLLALSLIQGYLINNTYKLEKDVFISETKKSISRLDDLSPNLDTINDLWQAHFLNIVADYYVSQINKKEVLEGLHSFTDSINNLYISKYQTELKGKEIGYDLKFQKVVHTIIVIDSLGVKNDTLFTSKNTPAFHLLGDEFSQENGHKVSSSMWLTDHTFDRVVDGKLKSIFYKLQFQTEDIMNIDGWEKIVLKRLSSLLVTSIFIFLLVFGLLFYSIKNLINQKKIAEVKTDFVNNLTHELKTPLATLKLATKLLKNNNENIAANNTIETIERQNIRLQKLIDQVFTNSLGYKEIQLQKETINGQTYFESLIDDFKLSQDTSIIHINSNIRVDVNLKLDKFYFTTAVLNILENAVKYGVSNVKIDFTAEIKKQLIIRIKDNGIGISSKEIPFIFDKFYRVGNKEIHNVKGLGLGLYYANQIIKAHQGIISVKSEQNKGTEFIISIPLK